jgi:hypothetical protein
MKTRTTVLMLALCLISSLVLADNPSDSQLVVDDGSVVVQQDEPAGVTVQHNKKEKSLRKKTAVNVSSTEGKKAARNPEGRAKANAPSAL